MRNDLLKCGLDTAWHNQRQPEREAGRKRSSISHSLSFKCLLMPPWLSFIPSDLSGRALPASAAPECSYGSSWEHSLPVTKPWKWNILPVFIFNKPFRTKAAKLQFHSQFWETEVNRESDFPIANSSAILKRKSIPLPSFWQSTRISSYLCSLSLPPSSQNQDKEVDKSPQGLSWATAAKYRKQESAMELRGGGGGRKKDTDTSLSKHRLFSW